MTQEIFWMLLMSLFEVMKFPESVVKLMLMVLLLLILRFIELQYFSALQFGRLGILFVSLCLCKGDAIL